MARAPMGPVEAQRTLRIAQGAVIAAAVLAVGSFALDLRPPELAPPGSTDRVGVIDGPGGAAPQPAALPSKDSATQLAGALELIRVRAAPKGDSTPSTPIGTSGAWRYIGSISRGTQRAAVLVIDGQQRILNAGQSHGNTRVLEVRSDAVVVEDGTGLREIRKGEPTTGGVAWVRVETIPLTVGGATTMVRTNRSEIPGQPNVPVSLEERRAQSEARLRDMGLRPGGNGAQRPSGEQAIAPSPAGGAAARTVVDPAGITQTRQDGPPSDRRPDQR